MLRRPVILRSCRDPEIARTYPTLRGLDCAAPALGPVRADETVRWRIGSPAVLAVLPFLRWSAPGSALRIASDGWRLRRGASRW